MKFGVHVNSVSLLAPSYNVASAALTLSPMTKQIRGAVDLFLPSEPHGEVWRGMEDDQSEEWNRNVNRNNSEGWLKVILHK